MAQKSNAVNIIIVRRSSAQSAGHLVLLYKLASSAPLCVSASQFSVSFVYIMSSRLVSRAAFGRRALAPRTTLGACIKNSRQAPARTISRAPLRQAEPKKDDFNPLDKIASQRALAEEIAYYKARNLYLEMLIKLEKKKQFELEARRIMSQAPKTKKNGF